MASVITFLVLSYISALPLELKLCKHHNSNNSNLAEIKK